MENKTNKEEFKTIEFKFSFIKENCKTIKDLIKLNEEYFKQNTQNAEVNLK